MSEFSTISNFFSLDLSNALATIELANIATEIDCFEESGGNFPQIMGVNEDILSQNVWIAGVVEETANVALLLCVHDVGLLILTKHGPH